MRKIKDFGYAKDDDVEVIVLCDDGTMWEYRNCDMHNGYGWVQLPDIPQPKVSQADEISKILKELSDMGGYKVTKIEPLKITKESSHVIIRCRIKGKSIEKDFKIDPECAVYPQIWQSFRNWISDADC